MKVHAPLQNSSSSPLKILIVEDNPDDRAWLRIHLKREGLFCLTEAQSLQEALDLVNHIRVDLIFLDLGLPDSDGLNGLLELQKLQPELPIIVLTGIQNDHLGQETVRYGAQEFLDKKDVSPQTLRRTIVHAIERKRNQNAFRVEVFELRLLLAGIPCVLIGLDKHMNVSLLNDMGEKLLGLQFQDIFQTPFHSLAQQLNIPGHEIINALETCQIGQAPLQIPTMNFRINGQTSKLMNLALSKTGMENPGTPHFLILANDVTRIHQVETQLGLAQKMESIGQLAAGIAHEINTPIQYISDNLRFFQESFTALDGLFTATQALATLARDGSPPEATLQNLVSTVEAADLPYLVHEIPQALRQSLEGAERVAKIVRAMKEFSHPGSEEKKPTDLNQALETTITVARNEWKYVAEMERHFDPTLPLVPALPGELNQVFLNLLVNAAQAIGEVIQPGGEEKGRITVSTRQQDLWAEIRIQDTGPGIPEAIRQRIFEPFFTTKEVGKGTGQGLAIAHDVVVNKHGGKLFVEPELGRSTTFCILLPIHGSGKGSVQTERDII